MSRFRSYLHSMRSRAPSLVGAWCSWCAADYWGWLSLRYASRIRAHHHCVAFRGYTASVFRVGRNGYYSVNADRRLVTLNTRFDEERAAGIGRRSLTPNPCS